MNDCYLFSLFLFANFFLFLFVSSSLIQWNLKFNRHTWCETDSIQIYGVFFVRLTCLKCAQKKTKDRKKIERKEIWSDLKCIDDLNWAQMKQMQEARNEKIKLLFARRWICFCVAKEKHLNELRKKVQKRRILYKSSTKQLRNCSKFWKTDLAHMKTNRKTY